MKVGRILGIIALVILGLLILALIVGGVAWAVGGSHYGMMYRFGPGMMRGFDGGPRMLGGGIAVLAFFLLVIVAIGALIWWLVSRGRGQAAASTPAPTSSDSALEILKQRYARGEIDHEEFQRRKELLQSN